MPESAAEAMPAPDDIREELIAKAAALWAPSRWPGHGGGAAEGTVDGA